MMSLWMVQILSLVTLLLLYNACQSKVHVYAFLPTSSLFEASTNCAVCSSSRCLNNDENNNHRRTFYFSKNDDHREMNYNRNSLIGLPYYMTSGGVSSSSSSGRKRSMLKASGSSNNERENEIRKKVGFRFLDAKIHKVLLLCFAYIKTAL